MTPLQTTMAVLLSIHGPLMSAAASRAQRVAPTHSDGPFCSVVFATDRDGHLRTWTPRGALSASPARSLVKTIVHCDDSRDWHMRFIDTDCVRITRSPLPARLSYALATTL